MTGLVLARFTQPAQAWPRAGHDESLDALAVRVDGRTHDCMHFRDDNFRFEQPHE